MIVAVSNVQAVGVAVVFLVLLFVAVAPSPREYRRGTWIKDTAPPEPGTRVTGSPRRESGPGKRTNW